MPCRAAPNRMKFEERFADEARFIRSWFDSPLTTGAVTPSGRFLARAMARCLADVAARIPPGAAVNTLNEAQDAELLNWDAEKYRQALETGRARGGS